MINKCLLVVMFLVIANTGILQAENAPQMTGEELVDVGGNVAKTRLDRLERRLSDMERDIRSLNEKVRSLDDNIDDLRRRLR